MTDAEIDALAVSILMEANNEKWYEQKVRIVAALNAVKDAVFDYAWEGGFKAGVRKAGLDAAKSPLVYTGLGYVPRDFMPQRLEEEG